MDYSIVIPAYNESKRIGKSIDSLHNYFSKQENSFEIIVFNDGSTDKTRKILLDKKTKIPELKIGSRNINQGKGEALKSGVFLSTGKKIAFADADLSTPPKDMHKLLQSLEETDVAIASRYVKGAKADIPFFRFVLSRVFNVISRILFLHNFKDTQCGFKAFKEEVKPIVLKVSSPSFIFDIEFLMRAKAKGFNIKEIPVTWVYAEGTTLKKMTPLKMLFNMIQLRIKYINGFD